MARGSAAQRPRVEAARVRALGSDRRRRYDLAARVDRRRAQLGLSLSPGCGTRPSPSTRFSGSAVRQRPPRSSGGSCMPLSSHIRSCACLYRLNGGASAHETRARPERIPWFAAGPSGERGCRAAPARRLRRALSDLLALHACGRQARRGSRAQARGDRGSRLRAVARAGLRDMGSAQRAGPLHAVEDRLLGSAAASRSARRGRTDTCAGEPTAGASRWARSASS